MYQFLMINYSPKKFIYSKTILKENSLCREDDAYKFITIKKRELTQEDKNIFIKFKTQL